MELIYSFIYYLILCILAASGGMIIWWYVSDELRCFIDRQRARYHSRKADELASYSIQLQILSTKYQCEAMREAIKVAEIERSISERRYQRSRAAS